MQIIESSAPEIKDSLLVNVSLVPPENMVPQLVKLSAHLGRYGAYFNLGATIRRPHLTLFMARLSANSLDDAVAELAKNVASPPLSLRHTGYHSTPGGYIEVSYSRTEPLLNAQRRVATLMDKHRLKLEDSVVRESYYGPFSRGQQTSASAFGYDLMGALYRPHITLNRFASQPKALVKHAELPAIGRLSFRASSIQVSTADDNGSVIKVVKRIQLS